MEKAHIQTLVDNMLTAANTLVEGAMTLGREHRVEVNLNKVNISDDMWYVTLDEYRREQMDELTWGGHVPTQEELAELEERLQRIQDEGGYEDGYKVVGWMSSSTNC